MSRPHIRRRPYLKDIAAQASVSIGTVSRVLSNTYKEIGIREETRERVLEVVHRMGYVPHQQARGLRMGTTSLLGVCLPAFGEHYSSFIFELFRGIFGCALDNHKAVMFTETRNSHEDQDAIDRLMNARVDGIIFWQRLYASETSRYLNEVRNQGTPVVVVVERDHLCECPFIGVDHINGGELAAHHLAFQRYRRLAYIGPLSLNAFDEDMPKHRYTGFEDALRTRGITLDTRYVVETRDSSYEDGCSAASRLLLLGEPPDAIFAYNDKMALGALKAIADAGKRVPQDVAIVGYDGIEAAMYADPPLTTVSQPLHTVGRYAVEKVLDAKAHPDVCLVPPELVMRASSANSGA